MDRAAELKRKFDEVLAQANQSDSVRAFLDEVALLKQLRCVATKLAKKPRAGRHVKANKAKLAAALAPLDETLDRITALSASIPHPSSLTPPVLDHQWQANDTERLRQRLARNRKGTGTGKETMSVPAHFALQQLNSVPKASGVNQNRKPATAMASKLQKKKREQAQKHVFSGSHETCARRAVQEGKA